MNDATVVRWSILRTIVATWCVYTSVGVLVPLVPQYICERYGSGATAIGVAVLVYGAANVAARPIAGWFLRSGDPWRLMTLSVVVGVAALLLTPLAPNLPWMLALRFVEGATVGMFYTAAATNVVRQTPHTQRGRVLSYFSVPLILGVAVGPVIGDVLIGSAGLDRTWLLSGVIMLLAVPVCLVRTGQPAGGAAPVPAANPAVSTSWRQALLEPLIQPAAVWPAIVLALSIAGFGGFQALVPVYGPQIGLQATGSVFFVYSVLTMLIRVACATVFDRLPIVEAVLVGCVADVAGLAVVWLWPTPAALYVGAVLMAVAIALQYVLLMKLALTGVSRSQEGTIVAAYSSSYDMGAGLGAAAMGLVVSATGSYRSAFLAGAVCALFGAIVLVVRFWSRRHMYVGTPIWSEPLRADPE